MKTIPLCVDCIHCDSQYNGGDYHSYTSRVCRARATYGPNPVTGYMEWSGKSTPCSDARRAHPCGRSGRLFKAKPPSFLRRLITAIRDGLGHAEMPTKGRRA